MIAMLRAKKLREKKMTERQSNMIARNKVKGSATARGCIIVIISSLPEMARELCWKRRWAGPCRIRGRRICFRAGRSRRRGRGRGEGAGGAACGGKESAGRGDRRGRRETKAGG